MAPGNLLLHPAVFLSITILCFLLLYLGTGGDKKVLWFFPLWILLAGTLSYTGFFHDMESIPPRILAVLIPSVLYIIYFYRKLDPAALKPAWLLSIHILRIPVEMILYQLFLRGKIPLLMTYKGWNFDILAGITAAALLLYYLLSKRNNRFLLLSWNILGLCSLAVIVTLAMLSAPSPFQQLAFEQPNTAIFKFPFTLLPAAVVPIVLLSHLLSIKYILTMNSK